MLSALRRVCSMLPSCMPGRALCTEASDEAKKALVQRFLDAASRPKMGKGRAKQSAGQRALDLGKQAKSLEDLDLPQLLALDGASLKERNVGCQERKRLLKFIAKANQGYTLKGKDWRSFQEPLGPQGG